MYYRGGSLTRTYSLFLIGKVAISLIVTINFLGYYRSPNYCVSTLYCHVFFCGFYSIGILAKELKENGTYFLKNRYPFKR